MVLLTGRWCLDRLVADGAPGSKEQGCNPLDSPLGSFTGETVIGIKTFMIISRYKETIT